MSILGLGIDLVEMKSFAQLYDPIETDLTRVFSKEELQYAGTGNEQLVRLAARFAAKEAVLKALGCGLEDGISLTDIVILRDEFGPPQIELRAGALEESVRLGVSSWRLSLTHTETSAGAVVVALGSERT